MDIEGKAVVVSGGGSGIGRAAVLELVRRGARVIVADIDEASGRQTVDLAGAAGGIAVFRRCDVTHPEDLAGAFASAAEHFGGFDIAFNNAGIGGDDLFNDETAQWTRMVDINLTLTRDVLHREQVIEIGFLIDLALYRIGQTQHTPIPFAQFMPQLRDKVAQQE